MSKEHPAILPIEDFVFYVIFTNYGGYGYHTQRFMRKDSRKELGGETIKNGRFKQTEWCCVSDSDNGMASIKYVGIMTLNGIKEFMRNFSAAEAERTMGSLTEYGHLRAISLQTEYGWEFNPHRFRFTESELKRRFGSKYNDLIYRHQYGEDMNVYVSPFVLHERVEQIFRAVFGKDYREIPKFYDNKHAAHILMTIDNLCKKLEDFLIDLNEERSTELDVSQFTVDCRQLELFENCVW